MTIYHRSHSYIITVMCVYALRVGVSCSRSCDFIDFRFCSCCVCTDFLLIFQFPHRSSKFPLDVNERMNDV